MSNTADVIETVVLALHPRTRKALSEKGIRFAGINPEKDLVEIIEMPEHPWFVAVQFHPEFKSKPHSAHPLFANFIASTLKYKR